MIYIYGDSHAYHSLAINMKIPFKNYHCNAITMHRIGRDNKVINFNNKEHNTDSILCFCYGEIDCRCHIQKQINMGRNEDDVISELVNNYFKTLKNNIQCYNKIIVLGVIPPTKQSDYETLNGPILHEFPFIGTDEARVRYTKKVNVLIEESCVQYGYIYFNPYGFYTREDGTLKYELTDKTVHIGPNSNNVILEQFMNIVITK